MIHSRLKVFAFSTGLQLKWPALVGHEGTKSPLSLSAIRLPHRILLRRPGASLFGFSASRLLRKVQHTAWDPRLGDIYLGLRDAEEVAKSDPMLIFGGAAPALAMLVLMPTIAKVLLGTWLQAQLRSKSSSPWTARMPVSSLDPLDI